ncbi:MAG: fumarylacetoacetate hydrolase family protein [Oscillatoriales cyanobacterium SM2_1_8]|nr:fumarylacetoacetate hydrolase family protein [Oscillatoriales cyanobacterium SM2_1_8]
MAERWVRVQADHGETVYGRLEPNQAVQVWSGAPWQGGTPTGQVLPPESYRYEVPCQPQKIVGVGRNYPEHAAELGEPLPSAPLLFLKPPSALLPADGAIALPPQSQQVEYEGELAIVIGEPCQGGTLAEARAAIWGYTIANDVTARDLQRQDGQWTRAKGFDTFCPLGPWIVREVSPTARLQTFLNGGGQPVQSATVDTACFAPEILVAFISQGMTLQPGDVILTGTPAGTGPLQPGDRVQVEIEGIGKLHNRVVRASARC